MRGKTLTSSPAQVRYLLLESHRRDQIICAICGDGCEKCGCKEKLHDKNYLLMIDLGEIIMISRGSRVKFSLFFENWKKDKIFGDKY